MTQLAINHKWTNGVKLSHLDSFPLIVWSFVCLLALLCFVSSPEVKRRSPFSSPSSLLCGNVLGVAYSCVPLQEKKLCAIKDNEWN